jgi:hypothetical protein
MDANKIIENLLERIKGLVRENAFLSAQIQTYEDQLKQQAEAKKAPVETPAPKPIPNQAEAPDGNGGQDNA